eukprot:gnl/TRDRNA2_/TRDRNA2_177849_c0_seq1.p3 gnl/TRDRNA2_/TRDRNA2_177849_c0~~gnl/TRDRNA2_/TRDRNA2_177849_c0_seq1.p3  ORF type:complete len:153 (+),score=12.46 gnl/TRDRNA2_/TRDRNA2_177849_c0_seq1:116-574(+)
MKTRKNIKLKDEDFHIKWPKGIFRDPLTKLIYGCGSTKEVKSETIDILEEIAIDYIHGILDYSSNHSYDNKLSYEDILISFRRDPYKFARSKELIELKTIFRRSSKSSEKIQEEKTDDAKVKLKTQKRRCVKEKFTKVRYQNKKKSLKKITS